MKKRILFLIADTGGGHRTAAEAVAEAIHYLYPNRYETLIEDILKNHTPWPAKRLPDLYPWLTGPGTPLWKLIWYSTARLQLHRALFPLVDPIVRRTASRYLRSIRPNLVVSVHPLLNHLGLSWLNSAGLDIPFVTVVTDLVSIHPTWICPLVTRCLVPTELAGEKARAYGMVPEKVKVCGQPVGLKFTAMAGDKCFTRHKLGLDKTRRTVLLMGGGEGRGPVLEIARTLAQAAPQAQLLIVAGRNGRLKAKLEAIEWEIPTRIYAFVETMPELMRAADILLTKAGPGTLSEAFIAGLPVLVYGYIPGQEEGNVTYVQQHRVGVYADTPQEITRLVLAWLDPANSILQQMAANALCLARPAASCTIATEVCGLL